MDPISFKYNPIGDIAANRAGSTLVLTHPRERALSIIDTDDPSGPSLIKLDSDPVAVAVAGGRAFVATTSASYDAVYVLDVETRILVRAHPLELTITSLAASADGARVFAAKTGRLGNDVAVVDIATETVRSVPVPTGEAAIVDVIRAGDSGMLYLGISGPCDGGLAVVDAPEGRRVATLPVGAPIRDLALSPADAVVYLLAHHPRGAAAVMRIDTAHNAIDTVVTAGDFATQVAVSPDGGTVYAVEPGGITVISAAAHEVVDHIAVGGWPSCVAGSAPDRLYVANYAGALTALPAVTPAPAMPPSAKALDAVIADPAAELQAVAV
jgi:DNA-binding beta-propeller fold protein YncE